MWIGGLIPATVTPFREDGAIDYEDLERHIATVSAADGVTGIAVNGHAGEVLTLSAEERLRIVALARRVMPAHLKLIAGLEGHALDELVRDGRAARDAGADGLLVLPPFDIRPYRRLHQDPDSVFALFSHLDREINLPMIVFQYSEASGSAYSVPSLRRIADIPNVVGIKAGTADVGKYADIHDAVAGRVAMLAASDGPPLLGMLLHGAEGALIGISVVATQLWSEMVREATSGSAQRAKEIFNGVCIPLMRAIFEYQLPRTFINPFGATKEALVQLGQLRSSRMRPPSVPPDDERRRVIREALIQAGLIRS